MSYFHQIVTQVREHGEHLVELEADEQVSYIRNQFYSWRKLLKRRPGYLPTSNGIHIDDIGIFKIGPKKIAFRLTNRTELLLKKSLTKVRTPPYESSN